LRRAVAPNDVGALRRLSSEGADIRSLALMTLPAGLGNVLSPRSRGLSSSVNSVNSSPGPARRAQRANRV
jgi:hypothetical protein